MLKYACKLCACESKIAVQEITPFQVEHHMCDLCIDDAYTALKASHQFNNIELHLRINLRKLRNNLQRVTHFDEVSSVIDVVQSEVSAIEHELGDLIYDYPSVAEVLSEYRSLLSVYK